MRPVPDSPSPSTPAGVATTAERYRLFATMEARGLSPSYEALALGVAEDPELIAVIDRLPSPKRQVNLVFGAARMLGAPVSSYREFRAFVLSRAEEVLSVARERGTQTNEARRVATLLPYLAEIAGGGSDGLGAPAATAARAAASYRGASAAPVAASGDGRPLALIEVGASAGLCLHPDRYSYRYDGHARLDPATGPSDVLLECRADGTAPVPDRIPEVVWRAGIDLNPLDPGDVEDRAWLQALIWPEHDDRRERLEAAARVAAAHPVPLHRGDLLELLPEVAAQAPTDARLVIFHTAVIAYLPQAARQRFVELMRSLVEGGAQGRPVHWIANEGRGVLPGIEAPVAPPEPSAFLLAVDGVPRAFTAPHGAWVHGF